MKLRITTNWIAVIFVVMAAAADRAGALSNVFTYQGQLQQSASPVNDNCDFQFSLWNAPGGGSQIDSTETASGVPVVNGLFTALLDFGPGAFTGENRWLQIAVRCPHGTGNYTTLNPRQFLSAAPYALYASSAGTASDLSCTSCVGSSDLATGAVTSSKIAFGTIDTNNLAFTPGTVTSVATGTGLTGGTITTSGTISANVGTTPGTVAAGDHDHDARYWGLTGTAGTNPSVDFVGTSDNQALELRVNGSRALRLEPTDPSPNLTGGFAGNGYNPGNVGVTIGGGGTLAYPNLVHDSYGTVGGGLGNEGAFCAVVSGGRRNYAGGDFATISGGDTNQATAAYATIAGGGRSDAGDAGTANRVSDDYGTVGGGGDNQAGNDTLSSTDAIYATVGGGLGNRALAAYAVIAGGGRSDPNDAWTGNIVTDDYGTVGGGGNNHAGNSTQSSTDATYATVSGGQSNLAAGYGSTVGGGIGNQAAGAYAFVGGGGRSDPSNLGSGNRVNDDYGTVGGGGNNQAGNSNLSTTDATYATVAGGGGNTASGLGSTIGGGGGNQATADYATVPGGVFNIAAGAGSFAAGRGAWAAHDGSFVWGDGTWPAVSQGANTFNALASGGFRFYFNANNHCDLTSTANWQCFSASDRNVKADFAAVDGRGMLARVAAMPIQTWTYKSEVPSVRHIGPMAQDFHAAFDVGEDDKQINTVDANGVALAAIQGLHQVVQEKEAAIAALQRQNVALEARVAALEQAIMKGSATALRVTAAAWDAAQP